VNNIYTPLANPASPSSTRLAHLHGGQVDVANLLHAKSSIIRLEEYMIWEALDSDWPARREGWVEEVCLATTVESLSRLVAEFGGHLFWEPSEAGNSERVGWLSRCDTASNIGALAEILLILEDYLVPQAFQEGWSEDRDHWGRMVQWLCPA